MGTPCDLYSAADEMLQAAIQSLDDLLTWVGPFKGAPERSFVSLGAPAIDCCDQLTVHAAQITDVNFGGGLAEGRKLAGGKTHVYLTVTIQRCVSMPADDGTPPPIEEMVADARQGDADAWALWNGIWALWRSGDLFSLCGELFMDRLRPLGPAGGCGGWTLDTHITLDGYEPAVSS
jgi:hypothetical protein